MSCINPIWVGKKFPKNILESNFLRENEKTFTRLGGGPAN